MSSIPNIVHFFWGGSAMPWMRYVSMRSFRIMNPSYRMMLWTTRVSRPVSYWSDGEKNYDITGKDYTQAAKNLADEVIMYEPPSYISSAHDVQKSDHARLVAMNEFGGVYADTDILFYSPVSLPDDGKFYVTKLPDDYQNGFIAASQGCEAVSMLLENSEACYDRNRDDCLGAYLFKKTFSEMSPGVSFLPIEYVNPIHSTELERIFSDVGLSVLSDSIALHWHGGASRLGYWMNRIDEYNYRNLPILFSRICKDFRL